MPARAGRLLQVLDPSQHHRVGVFDDRYSRRILRQEFRYQLVGCIRIIDVVIGKLLALKKRRRGNTGALFAGQVKPALWCGFSP